MKRLMLMMAALALPLGACDSTNQTAFITNVQTAAVAACKFLPAAETVAAIFTANASLIPAQVAEAICAAVMKPGAAPKGTPVTAVVSVGNTRIAVKGEFVGD